MLWKDIRYALRLMRRSPGFTAVAVLSLALGIGANTAIYSLFYTVMLRQLPVEHPEQLVELVRDSPSEIHWPGIGHGSSMNISAITTTFSRGSPAWGSTIWPRCACRVPIRKR